MPMLATRPFTASRSHGQRTHRTPATESRIAAQCDVADAAHAPRFAHLARPCADRGELAAHPRALPVRSQVCPALTATQPPAHPAGGSAFRWLATHPYLLDSRAPTRSVSFPRRQPIYAASSWSGTRACTAWPSVTNSGPMEARSSLPKQSAAIRISMRSTTGQNLCVQ